MSADSWAFYAYGIPAPQGSKRHVGRGVMVESSKKVKPWREAVKAAGEGAGPCLDGPLAVFMVFTVPRPKSAPRRVVMPDRIPDLSKLTRATEDAISEVGLWADDARVAEYVRLAKVFPAVSQPVADAWALPFPGVVVACSPADFGDPGDVARVLRADACDVVRNARAKAEEAA